MFLSIFFLSASKVAFINKKQAFSRGKHIFYKSSISYSQVLEEQDL